ncbi:D-alanyl-D-alanine dipeptidase [Zavarzinia compransoris]|uniref:D-alanyl-D-alanine dipeptidase n=1 Tax=Zavarzinia marina TaxID=2911065 RepID=UPI001F361CC7|nr:D-alanyl-D-alanine dipeptidase [Zavarzinia marina]MCF4166849.1 D-alanyl-D-alanine dipeptidase [Zavarzinia marina]
MLIEIKPGPAGPFQRLDYATANNITGRPIYGRAACFLHPDAAAAFGRARAAALTLGLDLLVFDGFRPTEAQWALWHALPDPTFIADPRIGSTHGRGVAVDLTLCTPTGEPLDMGTGFDEMTELSYHAAPVPAEARRNRLLLIGVMVEAGFVHNIHEWWHYNLPDPDRYPLLSDSAAGTGLMPRA